THFPSTPLFRSLDKPHGPAISITEPHDGDVVQSSSVWLRVKTSGVTLAADSAGNVSASGDGSYHVYLDGSAVGETTEDTFLVSEMAPGAHELMVRLFGSDGSPIAGASTSSVKFV